MGGSPTLLFAVHCFLKEGGRLALLCRHTGWLWAGRPRSFCGPWFFKEGGRLALLYSHAGSMWAGRPRSFRGPWFFKGGRATRPPFQPRRLNVGGSPTLLLRAMVYFQPPVACFKGGRATRPPFQPRRINVGGSPTLLLRSMAQIPPPKKEKRLAIRIKFFFFENSFFNKTQPLLVAPDKT